MLSLRHAAAAATAFSVFALAAAPAAARPATIFAKPGAGPVAVDEALKGCVQEARSVKAQYRMPVVTSLNPYAMLGGALAAGFIAGYEQGKARNAAVTTCMRKAGFGQLELTPEEAADLSARKSDADRAAWREAFLAKDLTARVQAALTPAVEPFAPAAEEPLTLGPVRFDPARLVAAADPVGFGQPLLSGPAAHRRTATLTEPLELPMIPTARAEQGAVFHQAVYDGDTTWCGTVVQKPLLTGPQHETYCFSTEFDGYHVGIGGEPWLGTYKAPPQPMVVKKGKIPLTESASDLLGPVDFALQASGVTKAGALGLEAVGRKDGKTVVFWRGVVPLDGEGRGVLPFWSHRVQLQKTGKLISARFTADGDGRGPEDPADAAPLAAPKAQTAAVQPQATPVS